MVEEKIIYLGNKKQLFIDNRWFQQANGVSLRVNPPVKRERVLVPEKPWEAFRIGAGTSIIEDEGVYRMWYDAIAPRPPEADHVCRNRFLCYAESDDGLHWERKNVNLFTWQGIEENNIVVPGGQGGIMKDPTGSDEHRYKGLLRVWPNDLWEESQGAVAPYWETEETFCNESELYICSSPDGIQWHRHGAVSDHFHDTHNHLIYDPDLGCHVAYVRTHERGRTVGRLEVEDPMDTPWVPLEKNGGDPAGAFDTVLMRDDYDPPETDLYTPCVHHYPWADDAYFSFTTPYRHYPVGRNQGLVDIQLAVSRDGKEFHRPDRRPYVRLGREGAWDAGMLYMCLGMIRHGDEIWMYYSGTESIHGGAEQSSADYEGGIARVVQRLDGFVSADADYTGATFTTPLLRFSGDQLELNIDCSALGEAWVEFRDEQGRPIPGYSLDEAVSVDGNRIAAPVRWEGKDSVAELAGRPVRMHVKLRACKLYAFQFAGDA
ncbi:MAG: hypothetical protein KGZ25_06815 [Planctomycetes bacterium]|nr:hypothetical protein [Planctomycetota bacterium]